MVGETCGLPRANTVRPYGIIMKIFRFKLPDKSNLRFAHLKERSNINKLVFVGEYGLNGKHTIFSNLVGETCGLPRANTVRPYGIIMKILRFKLPDKSNFRFASKGTKYHKQIGVYRGDV